MKRRYKYHRKLIQKGEQANKRDKIEMDCNCSIHTSLSPCLGLLAFLGKTISLLLYSFNLWTLAWRDSADLFFLLWSTAIPIVGATLREIPAAWNKRQCHVNIWQISNLNPKKINLKTKKEQIRITKQGKPEANTSEKRILINVEINRHY